MRVVKYVMMLLAISLLSLQAHALQIKSYDVSIEKVSDGFDVMESIDIERNNDTSMLLWIQGEAKNVEIKLNETKINYSTSGTVYSINLTDSSKQKIVISYLLPLSTERFMKQILYRCKEFSAKLNGEIMYQGMNLSEGSYVSFSIKERVVEKGNYYMYITFILLIILIGVLAYSLKSRKREEKVYENPEILKTKKELLMNLLKDLEKKYRAKEVSDDTYNKLKEHYKRETVNVVRKLEEMEKR